MAIARILAHSDRHPNVEEIYERLRGDFPTMSLATVYRNVMLLKSLGEVSFQDHAGRKHWTNAEAAEVVGRTRESTQEDLYNAIERGDFPKGCIRITEQVFAQRWISWHRHNKTSVSISKDYSRWGSSFIE